MTKLQLTMKMFLDNPIKWHSNRQLSFGVDVGGVTLTLNYLTDHVKLLERIVLPSGNRLRLERKRVKQNGSQITYYGLPVDLPSDDFVFILNSNNIKQVQMLKSKSIFDKVLAKFGG